MAGFHLTSIGLSQCAANVCRRLIQCNTRWFWILIALVPLSAAIAADEPFELVAVPGGIGVFGDENGEADETPSTQHTHSFRLMRHEVTNADFRRFVAATEYLTDAESKGWGYVWDGRWRRVPRAEWRHPHGVDSSIEDLDQHPVVQVSANDAEAFCRYHGLRLPSDQEWEFAARGMDARRFPWGNTPPRQDTSQPLANFGTLACCAADDSDGYRYTAPVGSYPAGASPWGLLDMAGNVWEWTRSPRLQDADERIIRGGGWGNNPYCLRTSYRHSNAPDLSLDMVGFRCAAN